MASYHPALLGSNHGRASARARGRERARGRKGNRTFPLLSSRSALFPLLSLLVSSQTAIRTCHCELRIRPSIPLPIHSTLCLTILGPNYCFLRPSHLDCACLSLLASLCALPSSLLGADPFLHHPALLGPNHLSSLFSLLFSLFFRCCSFPRSHFATGTSICASGHRLRAKLHRPLATPRSSSKKGFLI